MAKLIECKATWARGKEAEWWEWAWDEEREEYTRFGQLVSPRELLTQALVMQAAGWRLCLTTV